MLKILTVLSLLFFAGATSACVQETNTLPKYVGVDSSSGTIYVNISSEKNECGCTFARFSPSATDTKAVLSILLTAKTSNRPVRVDFKTEGDCDTAYRAYLK